MIETKQRMRRRLTPARIALGVAMVLAVVAAPVAATAATHGSNKANATRAHITGGTLTYANNATPESLDPSIAGTDNLDVFDQPAYASLTTLNANGTLSPGLATSWKFLNSKNTAFQMTLRQGVEFSDGEAMTADAVVASLKYWQAGAGAFAHFMKGDTITATNATTVTVTMPTPFPDLPYLFDQEGNAGDIIAPAGLATPANLASQTYGAGPYMLDTANTIPNSTYTYIPNPHYYDPSAIKWNKIVIEVITDTSTALAALESGQVQVMIADGKTAASVKNNPSVKILSSISTWSGIWILDPDGNKHSKAMASLKVREAMNYAINRPALTKALFGTYGLPSSSIRPPGTVGYSKAAQNYFSYNPTLAKKLLKEAGYPHGVNVATTMETSDGINMEQALVYELGKVGIHLKVKIETATPALGADLFSGNYEAWILPYGIVTPQLSYKLYFGQIPEYPIPNGPAGNHLLALYNKAVSEPPAQAAAEWVKVYAYATQEAYILPIALTDSVFFASKTVSAPAPGALGVIDPIDVTPAN